MHENSVLAKEVQALDADEKDRQEMHEVAALMASLRFGVTDQ